MPDCAIADLKHNWQPIATMPEGETVMTKVDDDSLFGEPRNVQPLRRHGTLYFLPDMSVYVYYRPTHWRWLYEHDSQEGTAA